MAPSPKSASASQSRPTVLAATRGLVRAADYLFSLPLPVPTNTEYAEIEIEPEASEGDIRWAIQEAERRLNLERKAVSEQLKAVYSRVPGLSEAYDRLESLRSQGDKADASDLKRARTELATMETKAQIIDARFQEKRHREQEIKNQTERLHRLALDKPEDRHAYDQQHPPLALFRLEDCTRDSFLSDPRTMMFLLRAEIAHFLEMRGETVFHPSDLTRDDFLSDFTYCELLDGPES